MAKPRDLTNRLSAEVRAELAAAVAVLDQHGPSVTEALRQLDQATTAAWNAVRSVEPTDDEWRVILRATGTHRGWQTAYRLVSTIDRLGQGLQADYPPEPGEPTEPT